jgi:hypothetical protein
MCADDRRLRALSGGLVAAALVPHRVHDHDRIHERSQQRLHGWIQVSELLISGAIQLPQVHASDAEPGLDLLPGRPLLDRRRSLVPVGVHTGQELPLGLRITPCVRLEPPAPNRMH